jgi:putative MATE family efflux protein
MGVQNKQHRNNSTYFRRRMANTTAENLQVKTSNRQILSIALPIAAAVLVPQINFVTNNIFLSHLPERGREILAVAGITGVYYLIFAVIGQGLNNGLQALISRRAGENRRDEIGKLFSNAVFISLLLAIISIVITYLLAPLVLRLAIQPENYERAISFLRIRIWGLPFLYVYQMRNALLVGTNNSRFLVIGTLAETVTNILLDYGFIFGHFGLPNLGFNGAAVASIIAEATGMVVLFVAVHIKGISRSLELYSHWRVDRPVIKLILTQSLPLIMQFVISLVSWELFYILVERHGARINDGNSGLAISNIMRNVLGVFGCVSWAFAATANSMVSNVIGQGKEEQVLGLVKKITWISVSYAILICILLNLFPNFFLSIYGQGPAFIEQAMPVLRTLSIALVLMSLGTVWLNAITGTGNTRINLMIEAVAIVLYCAYVWFVFEVKDWSVTIGWMSEWIYWLVMFSFAFVYMMSGKWKGKKI